MIHNLMNALYYSFIFYIIYSALCRITEIKKYEKRSTEDGTYSESYKIMYSKYLRFTSILTSTIMGIISFASNYTHTIFALAIGVVIGLCLGSIFKKYYPKPEENL